MKGTSYMWGVALLLCILCTACTSPSGGNPPNRTEPDAQLLEDINALFPFSEQTPIEVIYACRRANSRLDYVFDLQADGRFDVYITLDTGSNVSFSGQYTRSNGAIRLISDPNNILPLDETTNDMTVQMGLIYRFTTVDSTPNTDTTANMECVAIGHRYNEPEFADTTSYRCPEFRPGPANTQVDAVEFVHRSVPFEFPVPGSTFRDRNRFVLDRTDPLISRGYGIYRRMADSFYAYFGNQFDDFNVMSGSFFSTDQVVEIDQLEAAGRCPIR